MKHILKGLLAVALTFVSVSVFAVPNQINRKRSFNLELVGFSPSSNRLVIIENGEKLLYIGRLVYHRSLSSLPGKSEPPILYKEREAHSVFWSVDGEYNCFKSYYGALTLKRVWSPCSEEEIAAVMEQMNR